MNTLRTELTPNCYIRAVAGLIIILSMCPWLFASHSVFALFQNAIKHMEFRPLATDFMLAFYWIMPAFLGMSVLFGSALVINLRGLAGLHS
jgi:hypothetical protein